MKTFSTQDWLLCGLTGVLYPVSFMIPHAGILAWILFIPLFWAIQDKSPRRAFKLGLLTGTVSNLIGTYWLIGTLVRFGGFPTVVSAIFIVLLSAYSGLSYGIFSYITTRLGYFKHHGVLSVLLIASVWTSIEYLYPFLFPYTISNSQINYIPVIQIYDLFGIYSLTFVIVIVNLSLMRLIRYFKDGVKLPVAEMALSALLIFLVIGYGYSRIKTIDKEIASSEKLNIGMVQANFDFLAKTENQEEIVTNKHKEMSRQLKSADLIIWPETSIQAWFSNNADYLIVRDEIGVPDMRNKYFIVGGMSYTPIDENAENNSNEDFIKYNTAFLTNSQGVILGRYHKIKLLLFGEYLPFTTYFPSLKHLSPASGDFTPGSKLDIFEIKEKGVKIAPIICYEDIIPSFSRKFVDKGANLIVNITNDAWFGDSIAPYQHFIVSIPRAVETRKYLLRSTNTGISAIVDPVGRVVAKTDTFEQTNLSGTVGIMNGEKTLYTKVGYIFPLVCLVFWLVFAAGSRFRGQQVS